MKIKNILDWIGDNSTLAGIAVICTVAGLLITTFPLIPVNADTVNITNNQNRAKNPKVCITTKENTKIDCSTNFKQETESLKIKNSMMGFTNLKSGDKPWDSIGNNIAKLYNGTEIRILKQLDNESPTAAIALVEVLDGPHKGKIGKVNIALVEKN